MEFRNRIPNSIYIIGRDIIEFSLSACIMIHAYFLNEKENLLNHLSYIYIFEFHENIVLEKLLHYIHNAPKIGKNRAGFGCIIIFNRFYSSKLEYDIIFY